MKLKILLFVVAVFGLSGCATKSLKTSIVEVIEHPDKFDGKAIIVEGFAYLDIETKLICSAPEELNSCLWLQIPKSFSEIESQHEIETGSKIIASGVFKAINMNPETAIQKPNVIYIKRGSYWHSLQKAKLKKFRANKA